MRLRKALSNMPYSWRPSTNPLRSYTKGLLTGTIIWKGLIKVYQNCHFCQIHHFPQISLLWGPIHLISNHSILLLTFLRTFSLICHFNLSNSSCLPYSSIFRALSSQVTSIFLNTFVDSFGEILAELLLLPKIVAFGTFVDFHICILSALKNTGHRTPKIVQSRHSYFSNGHLPYIIVHFIT